MLQELDKYLEPWEKIWNLPTGITTRQWVPEAIAHLMEYPFDWLIEPTGAKFTKALTGFLLHIVPQFGGPALAKEKWTARDTEDLYAIGKHLLFEGLDPTPEDLVKLAESIGKLREGITYGDWSRIAKAFGAKSSEDIKAEIERVVKSFQTAFAIPTAPPAPPIPPMARETLASPPVAPTPEIPALIRMTSDTFQPPAPPIAKELFSLTLG